MRRAARHPGIIIFIYEYHLPGGSTTLGRSILRLLRGLHSVGCSLSSGSLIGYVIIQEVLQGVPGRVLAASTRDGVTDDDTLVRTVLLGASLRLSTKMH